MQRIYLPLTLLFVLMFEGVALKLLPIVVVQGNLLIISHWVLIILVFTAIFYDTEETNYSLIYAIVFGLLIDIVYTDILGIYMFTYAITVYIIKKLTRLLHSNLLSTILFGILGIVIADMLIYMIFTVIGLADIEMIDYLMFRLAPTLLANIIFLVLTYPLLVKRLNRWGQGQ